MKAEKITYVLIKLLSFLSYCVASMVIS